MFARMSRCIVAVLLVVGACDSPENSSLDAGDGGRDSATIDAAADTAFDWDAGFDAAPDTGASEVTTPLAVASWNIEQFPKHAQTIENVVALIEEHQLDLIGIQEITEVEPFEELAAALPNHAMYVSFDSRAFTRVGFLYRTDRIRVLDVDRLFTSDRYAFPRSPLVADIEVLDDEGEVVFDFTFAVVHLKAMLDEESRQRRIDAVQKLDAWVRDGLSVEPDVVVVGDWNDELTDSPRWNVFEPLIDAPDTYRFLTLESELDGAHTYIPFEAMIDHILITQDALDEYGTGFTEVLAIDDTMPGYRDLVSDHRPVVSHFAIPAPR